MERSEIFDLVTAYVDNELKNDNQKNRVKTLIDKDDDIRYEYQVQSFLKTYVKSKVHFVEAPQSLREQITSNLFKELKPVKKRVNLLESFFNFFKQPAYAFGTAVLILGAFLILFFSTQDFNDMAENQTGDSNMFVEARSNFRKILNGNLNLSYQSSDPGAIKEYFKEQGVTYDTYIPRLKNSQLIGAVVSKRNGEKLAHHVYRTDTGKLVYLYQADEKCIKNKKTLNLSDDLVKFIDDGKLYKSEKDGHSFLVWKNQGNVCVIVSNDNMQQLERELISTREYK